MQAFGTLCDQLDSQTRLSTDYDNYAKFVARSPEKILPQAIADLSDSEATTNNDSNTRRNISLPVQHVHSGRSVCSFAAPPSLPLAGWQIGYGKPEFGPVDSHIPKHPAWEHLRSFHLAIRLDDTGQFCIDAPRGRVKLDGKSIEKGKSCMRTRSVHYIEIADVLNYDIEFVCPTALREHQKIARAYLIQYHLHGHAPKTSVPITPAEYAYTRGDWQIGERIGQGGQACLSGRSLVRMGSHLHRPSLAATKECHYITQKGLNQIKAEVDLYKRIDAALPKHHHDWPLVVSLLETVSAMIPDDHDSGSVLQVLAPLAGNHLGLALEMHFEFRSVIFAAILRAMSLCHEHGIVHRDMKLRNVCLQENLPIVIVDLGSSVLGKPGTDNSWTPCPGKCGTMRYNWLLGPGAGKSGLL